MLWTSYKKLVTLKTHVDSREKVVTFIPEYAAYLLNRMEICQDGKTNYERVKGKRPTILGVEFGERYSTKSS